MSGSRRLVPFPEARHVLGGIGRSTVYDLIERRELTKVNIGRRSFITSDSLDAYMDRLAMTGESRMAIPRSPQPKE